MLDALLQKQPRVPSKCKPFRSAPSSWLGLPAEVFCQFGLDMKAGSKFPLTFPVSFANDCVGYIPTEEAFGEHGGGYETRLTSYTNLDITAGTADGGGGRWRWPPRWLPGAIPTRASTRPVRVDPGSTATWRRKSTDQYHSTSCSITSCPAVRSTQRFLHDPHLEHFAMTTRRSFLKTSLAAGAALTMPLSLARSVHARRHGRLPRRIDWLRWSRQRCGRQRHERRTTMSSWWRWPICLRTGWRRLARPEGTAAPIRCRSTTITCSMVSTPTRN